MYHRLISPLTHFFSSSLSGSLHSCRFFPTCSRYTKLAVKKYGIIRGGVLSLKRLTRCHPWTNSSFNDPVP